MKKLFTPIEINGVEVKNRIVMPGFGLKYCGLDRKPNDRLVAFYEARAKGGCGLIVVGGVGIDLVGSGLMLPSIESDDYIDGWSKMAEAVHRHGAKLFLQLFHAGRYQHSMLARGQQAVAPSAVSSRYTRETPRELEEEEIGEIQQKYAAAAVRAKEAGADGVELIASAGYLVCQFLSPITNLRTDRYGGSFENRCRFGVEVIEAVREASGPDFPITVRMSGSDFMPGGNTNRDIVEICKVFEAAGVDAFNVTGGWHETKVPQLPSMVPRGAFVYLASEIRRAVTVPVFASNRIVDPLQADGILADGQADMVCIGRAQIADPKWAMKAETGDMDAIRPCVGCLQGCLDRLFSVRDVQCLANPVAGFETEREIVPAETARTVVVVGAGPAGLEAAVTASMRGHRVLLLERQSHIGGQLHLSAAPPGREEFLRLIDYYWDRVDALGIEHMLGADVTAEAIREYGADIVVLATGAGQAIPNIPGTDCSNVVTAWDVLMDSVLIGDRVVVLGGGAVGIETAIAIAERGTLDGETVKFLLKHGAEDAETLTRLATTGTKKVTILEMLSKLGKEIGHTNKWVFLKELSLLGVETIVEARATAIAEAGVIYEKDGATRTLEADTVVLALGAIPETSLVPELEAAGIKYVTIGDARKPRNIMEAIHEGFLAALDL